ncbi:TalC/MipB family fructose-6-phosphate aldolase [Alkalibaculum bacchi]|uniref:TalC/MipB family fructose-6-phosphate aldolase n=1 Tax=Alkalibaculum bacchi TaxID=645887 RepID=A0A366IFR0_9FIRM|nr:transaldolase family protein [Alkalibaculum bacchi]RBP70176.1 TalC/MipB family fructose-6-phosphate aldolase [Alkalibaculum bacchi]
MYLDTANIDQIKKYIDYDWVKGVTTNPTLIAREGKSREEVLQSILEVLGERELFIQAAGDTKEEICADAKKILKQGDKRIKLKIAANEAGFQAMKEIKEVHPEIGIIATAIFSIEQCYIAALAGCEWVAPYIDRMSNQGLDSEEIVSNTAQLYANLGLNTKILGASFKNTSQIIHTMLAGADSVTIATNLLDTIMNNKLAADSIAVFNGDAKKFG